MGDDAAATLVVVVMDRTPQTWHGPFYKHKWQYNSGGGAQESRLAEWTGVVATTMCRWNLVSSLSRVSQAAQNEHDLQQAGRTSSCQRMRRAAALAGLTVAV